MKKNLFYGKISQLAIAESNYNVMPETERDLLYATVYETVREIPSGKVATYGQIACLIGLPRHARHVGYALKNLHKDSNVPWYRVVNARGQVHADGKRHLASEGIDVADNGRVSLSRYQWKTKESKSNEKN